MLKGTKTSVYCLRDKYCAHIFYTWYKIHIKANTMSLIYSLQMFHITLHENIFHIAIYMKPNPWHIEIGVYIIYSFHMMCMVIPVCLWMYQRINVSFKYTQRENQCLVFNREIFVSSLWSMINRILFSYVAKTIALLGMGLTKWVSSVPIFC